MSEPVVETILLSLVFLGMITFTYSMLKHDADDNE